MKTQNIEKFKKWYCEKTGRNERLISWEKVINQVALNSWQQKNNTFTLESDETITEQQETYNYEYSCKTDSDGNITEEEIIF